MPLRGESVGSAYVRIYADGSEVPDGIRDSLEDAEPSVREAGKKHGETYGEEFEKSYRGSYRKHFETTKGDMFGDLNEGLTDALAKLKLSDNFFKSKEWGTFLTRLENEFGLAGRLAGKNLEEQFRDSTDLDRLADEMKKIGPKIRAAQRELLSDMHADALADNKAFDRLMAERSQAWREMLEDAYRDNKTFDRNWSQLVADQDKAYEVHTAHLAALDTKRLEQQRKMLEEAVRLNREFDQRQRTSIGRFTSTLNSLTESLDRMERGESSAGKSRLRQTLNDLEALAPKIGLSSTQLLHFNEHMAGLRSRLDDVHPRLSRFDADVSRIGDRVGKLFGRGARNNFLNLFGTLIGMLAKSPMVLSLVARGFINLGDSIRTAFTETLKDGGSVFRAFVAGATAGLETIGGALATAGAAVVGIGLLFTALVLVTGPLTAIISGLVGILTALASTVVFGVIGAFAAWLPLIIPLAGIIGGIILAVNRFKDNAGPLADLFEKLQDRSQKWVDTFGDAAFKNIDKYGDRIDRAFRGLNPLFDAAGRGFDRFLDQITKGLEGPSFQHFFERFGQFLPHAMEQLGTIMTNTFGGLGGLLTGAIPSANRLLDWLEKITDKFNEWANSREGRRQIKDFLEKAGDSAESLGDFLSSAFDWLTKLLGKGQKTGDSIFGNMADDFDRWSKWLDDNPNAVKDWFGNAEDLSHDIGNLVDNINRLVDSLDNAQSRVQGNSLINAFGDVLGFISGQVSLTDTVVSKTWAGLKAFGDWLGWFFSTLGSGVWYVVGGQWVGDLFDGIEDGLDAAAGWLSGKFKEFWSSVTGTFTSKGKGGGSIGANIIDTSSITKAVTNALESLGRLPSAVGKIAGRVGGAFSGVPGQIRGFISNIPEMVGGIFARLPQPVQNAVSKMSTQFSKLPGLLGATASAAVRTVKNWLDGLPGQLAGIPGRIVDLFRGLAGKVLSAIGTIDIGSLIKVPNPGAGVPFVPGIASGGLFMNGERHVRVGEDGPEAVVPLRRDLRDVDPAVRALSAFAQGKGPFGNDSSGRAISADGWTIVTPSEDPRIVAQEMLDALVARIN